MSESKIMNTSALAPIKSNNSGHSLMDPPGYIKPSLQDLLLTDIDSKELRTIAAAMELEYLGPAASFPGSFPVEGTIWAPNHRLMVNLACRRRTKSDSPTCNVIFLVDTGSPVTYLCQEAMEALTLKKYSNLPQTLFVKIHSEKAIQTHISPRDSHFADVNVLGMDFIVKNRVYPRLDFDEETFSLY
jgi:hypothetical protein